MENPITALKWKAQSSILRKKSTEIFCYNASFHTRSTIQKVFGNLFYGRNEILTRKKYWVITTYTVREYFENDFFKE